MGSCHCPAPMHWNVSKLFISDMTFSALFLKYWASMHSNQQAAFQPSPRASVYISVTFTKRPTTVCVVFHLWDEGVKPNRSLAMSMSKTADCCGNKQEDTWLKWDETHIRDNDHKVWNCRYPSLHRNVSCETEQDADQRLCTRLAGWLLTIITYIRTLLALSQPGHRDKMWAVSVSANHR